VGEDRSASIEIADARQVAAPRRVARRALFYLSGYDPRGPGFYHRLYREQAALQAALTGAAVKVGPRRNSGPLVAQWRVSATYDGQAAETDYHFLRWDDQVRGAWRTGELALLVQIWRGLSVFARRGVLGLTRRRWRAPFFASLFPAVASSLYLAAMAVVGLGLWWVARAALTRVGAPGSAWIVLLAPLIVASQLRRGWRWLDARLGVSWLSRCISYMIDTAHDAAAVGARCDDLAALVAQAAQDPAIDEVLLVGHSQGCAHAARIAARLIQAPRGSGRSGLALSLLTLGQPFALYHRLAEDRGFKADLARLAFSDQLVWVDYTSPGDPVSSSDIDPLEGLGLSGARWPRRRSPRFHQLVSPARFRRMQIRLLDYHFQYLMAGERVGDYDFFRLTAGPQPLSVAAAP